MMTIEAAASGRLVDAGLCFAVPHCYNVTTSEVSGGLI